MKSFFIFLFISFNLIAGGAEPSQVVNNATAQKATTKLENSKTKSTSAKAQEFFGLEWFDKDKKKLPHMRLKDLKGKLTFINVFLKTCPGCPKSHKIFKKLTQKYKSRKDIQFLGVQSVSYGHKQNSERELHEIRAKYGYEFPMAQDNQAVIIMQYGAGGTPWNIVLGPQGQIEHNYFFISEQDADKYVKKFL